MMRRMFLAVAVTLAAATTEAEVVRVLSGEHANFSRIVLVFGKPVGWTERETPDGFDIRFDRTDISPNLGRVFDKIPKDRIRDVVFDRDTGTLSLVTACRCTMEVFEAGRNTIAIDVSGSADHSPDLGPSEAPGRVARAFPLGLPRQTGRAAVPELALDRGAASEPSGRPAAGLPVAASTVPVDRHINQTVAALEKTILEQLGRAATQGVARMADGTSVARNQIPEMPVETDQIKPGAAGHITARTVFDVAGVPGSVTGSSPTGDPQCHRDAELDVGRWALDPDPARALTLARSQLVSEFDTPSPEQVEILVRSYLASGFGAEARAVISEFDGALERRELYLEIARIVDGDGPGGSGVLSRAIACDGPEALWSLVAREADDAGDDVNVRAVQTWYVRLPEHLRRQLGPRIVENLVAAGHGDAAAAIREAILRTGDMERSDLRNLAAEAAFSAGEYDAAVAAYSNLVTDATTDAPITMRRLLEASRHNGRIDRDAVLTAEAIAFEHRGTEEGKRLQEEVAVAWARLGAFDAVSRVWADLSASSGPRPMPDPVLSAIASDLVASGADGGILAFLHSDLLRGSSAALTWDAASRLAGWSIANREVRVAEDLLIPFREDNRLEARRLRAGLALLKDEPALALSHVAAENDPASLALRADALSRLGDHAAASVLFGQMSMERDAAREAWLSGDGARIRAFGMESERAFVEAFAESEPSVNGDQTTPKGRVSKPVEITGEPTQAGPATPGETEPAGTGSGRAAVTLAVSRAMIEDSRASRAAIVALLQQNGIGDPAAAK